MALVKNVAQAEVDCSLTGQKPTSESLPTYSLASAATDVSTAATAFAAAFAAAVAVVAASDLLRFVSSIRLVRPDKVDVGAHLERVAVGDVTNCAEEVNTAIVRHYEPIILGGRQPSFDGSSDPRILVWLGWRWPWDIVWLGWRWSWRWQFQ